MTVDFADRVTVPDGVLARQLDDEIVILDLESESYYGLDDVGATMWNHLIEADSIETAYQALLQQYEVEPEQLRADLEALLGQLVDRRLLEIQVG